MMEHLEILRQLEYSPARQTRKKLIASENLVAELVCYEPGQATAPHLHPRQDEIFHIIEGRGTILVDEDEVPVSAGSVVFVPAGSRHGIRADAGIRLALMFIKGPGAAADPR
ncbi:MAG: cupin domain-containing protein [Deltaproteobacteria bacterium]